MGYIYYHPPVRRGNTFGRVCLCVCLSVCPVRILTFECIDLYKCGTIFLLLFVFLISSILHYYPALLHRHTLILDCLLTFFVAFPTVVLKLSFSQSLSFYSRISLPQADLLEL